MAAGDGFDCDLFVVGGGSGGVRAARIAAGHGARVMVAEESRMGGTCVIRGCVPKKLMIFAASQPMAIAEARGYGWSADPGRFDWPAFRSKLDLELDRLEAAYTSGLERVGVTVHHQRARLADPHTVELADGRRFTAKTILIAVGGRPVRPDLPGADLGMISDDLFLMDSLPRRALLVGGGFIACEFATILNGMGVDTTLAYRGSGAVLRGFDQELRDMATAQLRAIGVDVRLGCDLARLDRADDGIAVSFGDGSRSTFDAVLFATGRAPYTGDLGLAQAGVQPRDHGAVPVDDWSQTPVPSVFAVGDVTDRVNLTPVAIREGHAFADTMFGAGPRKVDHDLVASAVYLRPFEAASIGLTEQQAMARGSVTVFAAAFRPMRSMFGGSDARALMKLLVDTDSDRVLGCHIFGPEAGELIQLAAIPITMGATKADFDATMAVHPTIAEELVTMRVPVRHHAGRAAAGGRATG